MRDPTRSHPYLQVRRREEPGRAGTAEGGEEGEEGEAAAEEGSE
jgi:hypothetical protein